MIQHYQQVADHLRDAPIRSLSFNYHNFLLFDPDSLEDGQLGYSVGPKGEDLCDGKAGSWQPEWVVIGYDEESGDPFFVDTSEGGCPVYTAMHGAGEWDPELLAPSFDAFMRLLQAFEPIARTRSFPVALEENPITGAEQEGFWQFLGTIFPDEVPYFWESLIEEDKELDCE